MSAFFMSVDNINQIEFAYSKESPKQASASFKKKKTIKPPLA